LPTLVQNPLTANDTVNPTGLGSRLVWVAGVKLIRFWVAVAKTISSGLPVSEKNKKRKKRKKIKNPCAGIELTEQSLDR
jgi:hypothetical protein